MDLSRGRAIGSLALMVSLLCSAVAGWAQTGPKQSVKLKYPPGVYRLTLTSISGGSITVGNEEQKSQDQEGMSWKLTIAPPDAQGNKKAALKLTAVQEKRNGQEIWNSAQPDKGQAAVAFLYQPIMAADIQVAFDTVDTKNTLALEVGSVEPAQQNSPAPAAATNPPDKPAPNSPLGKPGGVAVTYGVYHYIDQGGLRDPQTGQWLEGFRILIPQGWKFTGGFRWIAREKPANLLTKTDLLNPVKSDYAITSPDGRSVLRQYPVEYWVQTNVFPLGHNYNGMIVCAAVTPEQYITQFVIPRQRGLQATDVKVIKQEPLDALAAKYEAESKQFDALTGGATTGNALTFKAGTVVLDYTENGVAYREQFFCIQQYLQTAGMVMWWPRMNCSMRAPREQFETQLPIFTTMALSAQTNPYWSIALIRLRDKVNISLAQADAYANKVRHEIAAAHAQTNHELARAGGYLSGDYYDYKGTDGNRYNLPTDKYHFMNKDGALLSQDSSVPPSSEWTSIEPYNQ